MLPNIVVVYDVLEGIALLRFGTITLDVIWCSSITKKVRKCIWTLRLRRQRVNFRKMASNSSINLCQSTTSISRDTIIMYSNIRKECVCCHIFIPMGDMCSGQPGFVVAMHTKRTRCTKPLRSILKGGFDMVHSGPAKVRLETIKDRAWRFHITG